MREIVYSDSGNGQFEPELTPAQKRKATMQAMRERDRRRHRREMIATVLFFVVVGVAWVGAHIAWVYLTP